MTVRIREPAMINWRRKKMPTAPATQAPPEPDERLIREAEMPRPRSAGKAAR